MNISTRSSLAVLAALVAVPSTAQAAGVVGHFRVAIDTNAANATLRPGAQQRGDPPAVPGLAGAAAQGGQPEPQGPDVQEPLGDDRAHQSGFVSGGVATQDAAAHPEWFLLNTAASASRRRYFNWIWIADVGSAVLPAEVGRQRARRDRRGRLGRRLHGRHQPDDVVALRRQPDRQVPDRRGLAGGHALGAGRRSARASAPPASW